jgi:hypothetical protein
VCEAADEVGPQHGAGPEECDRLQAGQQLFEHDPRLVLRQVLAGAGVGAESEREVGVGLAVDVELVGAVEDVPVAVSRLKQRRQPIAGLDGLATQCVVGQRHPHEVFNRRNQPQPVVDQLGDQAQVCSLRRKSLES